jgi:hypothetical protein
MADASNSKQVTKTVEESLRKFGEIDVLLTTLLAPHHKSVLSKEI